MNKRKIMAVGLVLLLSFILLAFLIPKAGAQLENEKFSHIEDLEEGSGDVNGVDFSTDYIAYARGGDTGTVHIHNLSDWSLETELTEASDGLVDVQFSPDNDYIAYSSYDGNVYIHDTSDWSLETTLTESSDYVYEVAWSPDPENFIAYGGDDDNVYVHDTNDWSHVETIESNNDTERVDFNYNGAYLAFNNETDVKVYYTYDWTEAETITAPSNDVESISFSSTDLNYLSIGTKGNTTYVYDTDGWTQEEKLTDGDGEVDSVGFSPQDDYLLYGTNDTDKKGYLHYVDNWDLKNSYSEPFWTVWDVAWYQNNDYFALSSSSVDIYERNTVPDEPSNPDPKDGERLPEAENTEISVDVSDPDGESLDVYFYDNSDDSLIDSELDVSSGGTASVTWTGLQPGENYSWYAVADDGKDNTESDVWSYSINSAPELSDPDPENGESVSNTDEVDLSIVVNDSENEDVDVKFVDLSDNSTIGWDNAVENGDRATTTFSVTGGEEYEWGAIAYDNLDNSESGELLFSVESAPSGGGGAAPPPDEEEGEDGEAEPTTFLFLSLIGPIKIWMVLSAIGIAAWWSDYPLVAGTVGIVLLIGFAIYLGVL